MQDKPQRIQLAIARIQGSYQLQSAILTSTATTNAAKIGARARYFHGFTTLIGGFGILGGFVYSVYEKEKEIRDYTREIQSAVNNQDKILQELVESYHELAKVYQGENELVKSQASHEKAMETQHQIHEHKDK